MTTVDKKPYWADAIGQIPFALDTYKWGLKHTSSPKISKFIVKTAGSIAAKGDYSNVLNPDISNSYDNNMIKKAADWAEKKYITKQKKIPTEIMKDLYKATPFSEGMYMHGGSYRPKEIDTTTHNIKDLFQYDTKDQ